MAPSLPPIGSSGPQERSADRRLDSWKEIAGYVERDVATVRRWEKREGLPVHRHHHDKLGSVYAYAHELDAWREGRHGEGARAARPAGPQLWARRHVVPGLLLLLLVLVAVPVWLARDTVPPSAPGITSIAVLPFQPLGGGAPADPLGLGMADALITRLSNVDQIQVRSMSAVQQYLESGRSRSAAGRALNVDALIEGNVQRSADRIRVTVQLLRVADGASLWAGTFDERFTDIFAVQDSISQQVVRVLPLTVSAEAARGLTQRDTSNAEAYQLYLKGRYFSARRGQQALETAVDFFRQAIGLDPDYARAYGGLADAYASSANATVLPSREAYLNAKAAALAGLERDNRLADAHTALGVVSLFYDWDWTAAERAFTRALALEPDNARAHRRYAAGLMWMGRFDEAVEESRRAIQLAPVDLEIHANLSLVLYFARRYDQAILEARKTLEMDNHLSQAHRTIARASVEKHLDTQAIAAFQQAIASGGVQLQKAELGHAYAVAGRRQEALAIRAELRNLARRRYVSPYDMALIHIGLGEKDQAFDWLEKSYAERERWMVTLKVAPALDPLRSDSRFADLVRRVGLWQ